MFKSDLASVFQSFLGFVQQLLAARWRSLLVLLIGVYLPLQLFGFLAVKVWQNAGGFPWDEPILLAIHKTAQPQLDIFALTLTNFGSIRIVFPVVVAIALLLLFLKRWRSLVFLLTASLGNAIINRTAKEFMHRVRPQLWDSPVPKFDFAFPSGHAMTSMTLVAALAILAWGSAWCWLIVIVGSLYVVAIAWTRLYLGVHFPSDILAGWTVAIAWVIGVSLLIKPHLTPVSVVSDEAPVEETSLLPEEKQALGEE